MTMGEKITILRKRNGFSQEELAQELNVSRQSVSRWEKNQAFPETEKLIQISKLFSCSIDYLLIDSIQDINQNVTELSAEECCKFIRECGYCFLATSVNNVPSLRPIGMVCADEKSLYIATDRRKKLYAELIQNSSVEIASYNLNTRKWLRMSCKATVDHSQLIQDKMVSLYPMISQEFIQKDEVHLVIFKLDTEHVEIK